MTHICLTQRCLSNKIPELDGLDLVSNKEAASILSRYRKRPIPPSGTTHFMEVAGFRAIWIPNNLARDRKKYWRRMS